MKYYTLNSKNDFKGKYGEIASGLFEEKNSKFYSYLFKIKNGKEAEKYIEDVRKENKEARHVVYIYSYLENNNAVFNFSDDGEPKGTGTKAIYELLSKENITSICIVIVRYFGGILLGAGPLSRAYLNSARLCIENCEKEEIYNYINEKVILSYNSYNILRNKLKTYEDEKYVIISNIEFSDEVSLEISIVDFKLKEVRKVIDELKYANR